MKMMIQFQNPIEPFNSMVRDGTAGSTIRSILEDLKPEAVYFTAREGRRGGIMIVNMDSPSEIPRYAEPLFLKFNAEVRFMPCMTPADLEQAGLDALGEKWG
ncbi:MAG: hypothetical protein R3301_19770 [Saprospiraceae bacterium]|nr:hypothetical protein [Saprospiraceae bacterium]